MNGRDFRKELERRKGQRDQVLNDLETAEAEAKTLFLEAVYCEEAQTILIEVAKLTQEELEYHISEMVTLAMAAVFDNPYELDVEFVQRRNRTECDLNFMRNGKIADPLGSSGGGAVDVACFALRVALWSLPEKGARTRNVIIEDEPLKWLKGGSLPEKGALMRKEISEKLGVQLISISHIPDQIEGADQRIEVKLRRGAKDGFDVSRVTIH